MLSTKKQQHLKYKIINRFKGKEWENDMKKNQKKDGPAISKVYQIKYTLEQAILPMIKRDMT